MAETAPVPLGTTEFTYAHKVFSIAGCRFALSGTGGDAVFYLPLGEIKAMLPLATVRAEFSIGQDSPDGQLLALIEASLRHVKEIRPGDSIPRELLDGTASWSVEDHHRTVARGRLSLRILSWMSDQEEARLDSAQLALLTENPKVRARVTEGMAGIALQLGLGEGEAAQKAVVDRIKDIARELAYLEALRERVAMVAGLETKLRTTGRLYKREQATADEIRRMLVLIPVTTGRYEGEPHSGRRTEWRSAGGAAQPGSPDQVHPLRARRLARRADAVG
jgi:hypothetical protein